MLIGLPLCAEGQRHLSARNRNVTGDPVENESLLPNLWGSWFMNTVCVCDLWQFLTRFYFLTTRIEDFAHRLRTNNVLRGLFPGYDTG
jgi:hypothetical protein